MTVHKGLDGIVVDTTTISLINPATNSLTYRGYPAQDLAVACTFEEVAYLIWHGELPSAGQREAFEAEERARRALDPSLRALLLGLPDTAHPMDVLRTAVSYLGALDTSDDTSPAADLSRALDLLAKLPTVVALDHRRRHGLAPIDPDHALGYAENFLHMCFGEVPSPEVTQAFDVSLILYAEHNFNASTFTTRVVTSTLSDLYSAVTAGIGALKGPLHGGANEAVMHMLDEIPSPEDAEAWLLDALATKRKVMGFGHRVYKSGDSRVPTMQAELERLAKSVGADDLMATYHTLAEVMYREKGLHPNVDYPTGPVYHLMGIDTPFFTPIFVMARVVGWTAHIIEQHDSGRLIRPQSEYNGPRGLQFVPIDQR
jgi:citrate synthase